VSDHDAPRRRWTEEDFSRRQKEIVAAGKAARRPSLAERLMSLPVAARERIMATLSPVEWRRLRYDWRFWGRPKQLAALDVAGFDDILLLGGRGVGKTRTGAETVRDRIQSGLARSVCFIGADWEDCRRTMVGGMPDTDSGILDVLPPWIDRTFNQVKKEITIPAYDCVVYLNTAEKREQRGGNFDLLWIDEPIKFRYLDTVLMNLDLALRKRNALRIFTTTPKRQEWLRELIMNGRTKVIHSMSDENAANLDPRTLARWRERWGDTRLGKQELEAMILGDTESAIASSLQIETDRVEDVPELDEVGVGIDPAVSTKRRSDDSGIMCCGRAADRLYVLEDRSGRYAPDGWARAGVDLAIEWGAKWIIVERNKIGDVGRSLLMHAMRARDVEFEIREAYSIKDKWTRAQGLTALYDRGHVHHVGRYPDLEAQLTQWDPREGGPSPNNLDAFVHCANELMELVAAEKPAPAMNPFEGLADAAAGLPGHRGPGIDDLLGRSDWGDAL
jgi:phage terminase large subunit-like protein